MRRGPDSAVAANLMTRFIRKTEFVCILPPDCRYSTWIAAHCPVPGRSQRMGPALPLSVRKRQAPRARARARTRRAVANGCVQEDSIYPNMWRVEFVDRTLSDISQPPYVRARARARGACLFLTDRGNAGPSVGFCRAQDNEPLSTSKQ